MYLQKRPRILRNNPAIRSLVAETILTPNDFILPLFICLVIYTFCNFCVHAAHFSYGASAVLHSSLPLFSLSQAAFKRCSTAFLPKMCIISTTPGPS